MADKTIKLSPEEGRKQIDKLFTPTPPASDALPETFINGISIPKLMEIADVLVQFAKVLQYEGLDKNEAILLEAARVLLARLIPQ